MKKLNLKQLEVIKANISASKSKWINKVSAAYGYDVESFIYDCQAYIKAIEERRMLCIIKSVSKSGLSRTLAFNSFEPNKNGKSGYYRQYVRLFEVLGYKVARGNEYAFIVNGSGMDMVFNTNYNNIHDLHHLGFISKSECDLLAQMTPTVL